MKGEAEPMLLRFLLYYQKNRKGHGSYLAMLDTTRNVKFDVTDLLQFEMPSNISDIQEILRTNCEAKTYLIFQCFENSRYIVWYDKAKYTSNSANGDNILAQFYNELRVGCRANYPKDLWELRLCLRTVEL